MEMTGMGLWSDKVYWQVADDQRRSSERIDFFKVESDWERRTLQISSSRGVWWVEDMNFAYRCNFLWGIIPVRVL